MNVEPIAAKQWPSLGLIMFGN